MPLFRDRALRLCCRRKQDAPALWLGRSGHPDCGQQSRTARGLGGGRPAPRVPGIPGPLRTYLAPSLGRRRPGALRHAAASAEAPASGRAPCLGHASLGRPGACGSGLRLPLRAQCKAGAPGGAGRADGAGLERGRRCLVRLGPFSGGGAEGLSCDLDLLAPVQRDSGNLDAESRTTWQSLTTSGSGAEHWVNYLLRRLRVRAALGS